MINFHKYVKTICYSVAVFFVTNAYSQNNNFIAPSTDYISKFVISVDKQYALDLASGQIWTRCLVGQTVVANKCEGKPTVVGLNEFTSITNNAIIPSAQQLSNIFLCSSRSTKLFYQKTGLYNSIYNADSFYYLCSDNGKNSILDSVFPNEFLMNKNNYVQLITSTIVPWENSGKHYFIVNPGDNKEPPKAQTRDFRGSLSNPRYYFQGQAYLILDEKNNKNFFLFKNINSSDVNKIASKLSESILPWNSFKENIESVDVRSSATIYDKSIYNLLILALENRLSNEVTLNLKSSLTKPERITFSNALPPLIKGEFETTSSLEDRIKSRAALIAKTEDEIFRLALAQYEKSLNKLVEDERLLSAEKEKSNYYNDKLLEIWKSLAPALLGNPILTNIRYDADQQVFLAKLVSQKWIFEQDLVVPVPLSKAPQFKTDLLSGKITPKIEFQFPSMLASWTLIENDAQRVKRFSDANLSIERLVSLITEFPDSAEAKIARNRVLELTKTANELTALMDKYPEWKDYKPARVRIFELIKTSNDFSKFIDKYSDWQESKSSRTRMFEFALTSYELSSLVTRYSDWQEAKQAKTRIPNLQDAEYRAAQQTNSSYGWQEFIKNFGGPDPKKLLVSAEKARIAAANKEAVESREAQRRAAEEYARDAPNRAVRDAANSVRQQNYEQCNNNRSACFSRCNQLSKGMSACWDTCPRCAQ